MKSVIIEYALEEFNQGKAHLDRKNESAAEACFERAYSELVTSVDHFALNKEKVLKLADDLIKETRAISAPEHVVSVDQNIKGVRELADKVKIDEESKVALILLCNAGIHREISPYLRRLRYGAYLTQVGWLTVWFYGIGIGFWIAAFCYRRKMF